MSQASPILSTCLQEFRQTKQMAEKCFAQLGDADFHVRINPHQNSIAVIIQHLAGNMISRWTDFLASDGEKPDRYRESEFEERRQSRAQLMDRWEKGWAALFAALESLTDADLWRVVQIRNEPHSVFHAINRQTAHYNLHLGQSQLIAKHIRGDAWKYLSIPPGGSREFNATMGIQ